MIQYLNAVKKVLEKGKRKKNRTGVDTISIFNINYEIDLRQGFPLLTTKDISWKNIVIENLWFLSGVPSIRLLKKHGCKFWDKWADDTGSVPSAYGNFWRRFPIEKNGKLDYVDQIKWVINELKRNPDSRRLVITAWAPGNALTSTLPPCHITFVLNVQRDSRGKPLLCLHLTQRSCDMGLGIPYNIAGYSFLLELFARFSKIPAGIFAHTLIDAHIYTSNEDGTNKEYDHTEKLKEQLTRTPRPLPELIIAPFIQEFADMEYMLDAETNVIMDTFKLKNYNPYPPIKMKVAI